MLGYFVSTDAFLFTGNDYPSFVIPLCITVLLTKIVFYLLCLSQSVFLLLDCYRSRSDSAWTVLFCVRFLLYIEMNTVSLWIGTTYTEVLIASSPIYVSSWRLRCLIVGTLLLFMSVIAYVSWTTSPRHAVSLLKNINRPVTGWWHLQLRALLLLSKSCSSLTTDKFKITDDSQDLGLSIFGKWLVLLDFAIGQQKARLPGVRLGNESIQFYTIRRSGLHFWLESLHTNLIICRP